MNKHYLSLARDFLSGDIIKWAEKRKIKIENSKLTEGNLAQIFYMIDNGNIPYEVGKVMAYSLIRQRVVYEK